MRSMGEVDLGALGVVMCEYRRHLKREKNANSDYTFYQH
jgi:hypothetical protein